MCYEVCHVKWLGEIHVLQNIFAFRRAMKVDNRGTKKHGIGSLPSFSIDLDTFVI